MADRKLGMRHVTDTQLARLAASLPPLRRRVLPPVHLDPRYCTEQLGFDYSYEAVEAEAYLVVDGRRVARAYFQ